MTINEVLDRLASQKIRITKRTFEYYQGLGLLPKPIKQVGKGGRGVYNLYETKTIDLIKHIYDLKARGYKLSDIWEDLEKDTIRRGNEALLKHGYRDIISGKIRSDTTYGQHLIDVQMRFKKTNDRLAKTEERYRKLTQNNFIKLKWWDPPDAYEESALTLTAHMAQGAIEGLEEALNAVGSQIQQDGKELQVFNDLSTKLIDKIEEILELEEEVLNKLDLLLAEKRV